MCSSTHFTAPSHPLKVANNPKNQKQLAEEFVQHIVNTNNPYIKGFNAEVGKGQAAVKQWYKTAGSSIVLKSTGLTAGQGGKAVTGMIGRMTFRGKLLAVGVPLVGTLISTGTAYAGGARDEELAAEVAASSTVVGGLAFEASHLRDIAAFQKAAVQFQKNPEWFFNTDTPNQAANVIGNHFNMIKRGAQVTSDEPTYNEEDGPDPVVDP